MWGYERNKKVEVRSDKTLEVIRLLSWFDKMIKKKLSFTHSMSEDDSPHELSVIIPHPQVSPGMLFT